MKIDKSESGVPIKRFKQKDACAILDSGTTHVSLKHIAWEDEDGKMWCTEWDGLNSKFNVYYYLNIEDWAMDIWEDYIRPLANWEYAKTHVRNALIDRMTKQYQKGY